MFILGFFWKKISSNAALFATIGGFSLSVVFKFLSQFVNLQFLSNYGFATLVEQKDKTLAYEIPFLDRIGFVFVICVLLMAVISWVNHKRGIAVKGMEGDSKMFRVYNGFVVGAMIIGGLLVALYSVFW